MKRLMAMLAVITALAGCAPSNEPVLQSRVTLKHPVGTKMSLGDARKIAPYPVRIPSYTPTSAKLDGIYVSGQQPKIFVAIQYSDGLLIEYLPRPKSPNYKSQIRDDIGDRLIAIRNSTGIERDPSPGNKANVRWYESGSEVWIIHPSYSAAELRKVADSLS